MNILDARKLQKLLYKDSGCDFKIARTQQYGDKICYTVSHLMCEDERIVLNKNTVECITQSLKHDVEIHIGHVSKGVRNTPEGMYIMEVVLIDD